jgi:hypothetical protein
MAFNKLTDKIAITIPEFRLKHSADGLSPINEPYIITLSVDESGLSNSIPSIHFNAQTFPKTHIWSTVKFDGDGYLIYGPKNPGSFVSYSILFMESDNDVREFGKKMDSVLNNDAFKIILKTLTTVKPEVGIAVTVINSLLDIIAKQLINNKDDELFRVVGTFFRDKTPPYDILRTYSQENKYISYQTRIIPLSESNGLGEQVKIINI